MRRLVNYWRPLTLQIVGGIARQEYADKQTAFLSMQPVDGGGSFRAYLAGRRTQDYMEAIGEADLEVTEEGEHNGAIVFCSGKYYEVVQRMEWQNGVINHYEYLLFGMKEKDALALVD